MKTVTQKEITKFGKWGEYLIQVQGRVVQSPIKLTQG